VSIKNNNQVHKLTLNTGKYMKAPNLSMPVS